MQSKIITDLKKKSEQIFERSDRLQRIINEFTDEDTCCSINDTLMEIAKEMCDVSFPEQVSNDDEIVHSLSVRNKARLKYNELLVMFIRAHIKSYYGVSDVDHVDTHFKLLEKTSEVKWLKQQHEGATQKIGECDAVQSENKHLIQELLETNYALGDKNVELKKAHTHQTEEVNRLRKVIESRDEHIDQMKILVERMINALGEKSFNEAHFWKNMLQATNEKITK